jgi:hypothetical protein
MNNARSTRKISDPLSIEEKIAAGGFLTLRDEFRRWSGLCPTTIYKEAAEGYLKAHENRSQDCDRRARCARLARPQTRYGVTRRTNCARGPFMATKAPAPQLGARRAAPIESDVDPPSYWRRIDWRDALLDARERREISLMAFAVGGALEGFADNRTGESRPSIATIARRVGGTIDKDNDCRTVRRALAELKRAGLVALVVSLAWAAVARLRPELDEEGFDLAARSGDAPSIEPAIIEEPSWSPPTRPVKQSKRPVRRGPHLLQTRNPRTI